jgi:folate-dependent phosphoribosylglycinamide formyltransferase PurN
MTADEAPRRLTLGWFSTGRGEGSRGLLAMAMDAIRDGELAADVLFVFCNRDPGEHAGSDEYMALAGGYGIPLVTLSSIRFRRELGAPSIGAVRQEYDREVMARLEGYEPDLCVMAGYGLILGPEMCRRYDVLNLHPALPGGPIGTWQQVIWRLIEDSAEEQGAMVHLATEELDQGPPITYVRFPIRGEAFDTLWEQVRGLPLDEIRARFGEDLPLFQAIRREGMRRERPLLLETLKSVAAGRLRIVGRRVLDREGLPVRALCLNDEVDRAVAESPHSP